MGVWMRGIEAARGPDAHCWLMALSMFVLAKYGTGGDGDDHAHLALSQPAKCPLPSRFSPPLHGFLPPPTLPHPPVLCFCVSVAPTRHPLVDTTSQKPKSSNVFLSLGLCPSLPRSPLRDCRLFPPWHSPPSP